MYVKASDLGNFPGLSRVDKLDSVEDVATLIDTFVNVRRLFDYKEITEVLKDSQGYYYFVVGGEGEFDLYSFINSMFDEDVEVSCVNAWYLFPERLSRGVREGLKYESKPEEEVDEVDEDDIPTGYLEGNPLGDDIVYSILRKADGTITNISESGITMGRGSKADYVIKGNTNLGRVHCNLYVDRGVLKVHDFNSLNGTFVNNRRVANADVVINIGDKLTLADEEFEIVG